MSKTPDRPLGTSVTIPRKKASSAESLAAISNVLIASFVFCFLYFGRDLLVPIALATLLTFLFSPLCTWLQRWLGRIGSVLAVVAIIFAATIGTGWVLSRQAVDLANQLPSYKENIRDKLRDLKLPESPQMSRVSETLDDLEKELPGRTGLGEKAPPPQVTDAGMAVIPVEIVGHKAEGLEFVSVILSPILGPLGTAALVLLLLIFMLLQREDLQNRIIRLIGQGRISTTTRAMEDAGSRVARYLLMQLVVNVTYGIPVAVGLYFIGVPNAILWGALATVLRFIPYVGPWIAAAFPLLLSLAVSPSWMAPALTLGLFIVLEIISNNVMEPWLYGSSTGVSPIALIIAALLWTGLWGPVGLVLATPITVCLVVMGRHIPRLSFLSVILSDEEPLTPAEDCYHRLHRRGENDALELVDSYLKTHSPAELMDTMLLPVISTAETDYRQGFIDSEQLRLVHTGLDDLLEEMEIRSAALNQLSDKSDSPDATICCVPAKASRDELAGEMLTHLLRQSGRGASNASSKMVTGEMVEWVKQASPKVVCVSVVTPTTISHARYLCSRLRAALPDVRILVGLWDGVEDLPEVTRALRESGANEIFTSTRDVMDWLTAREPNREPEIAAA